MKTCLRLGVVSVLLFGPICHSAVAQPSREDAREWLIARSQEIVPGVWSTIRPKLDKDDRELADEIELRVTTRDMISARAIVVDGKRVIEFDFGMHQSIEMMIDALFLGEALGRPSAALEYAIQIGELASARARGVKVDRLPSPYEYFGVTTDEAMRLLKPTSDMREQSVVEGIALVLLHELGHHAWRHVDQDECPLPDERAPEALRNIGCIRLRLQAVQSDPSLEPEQRQCLLYKLRLAERRCEEDADRFAASYAVSLHMFTPGTFFPWTFLHGVEYHAIERNAAAGGDDGLSGAGVTINASTHPMSLSRAIKFLERMRNDVRADQEDIEKSGMDVKAYLKIVGALIDVLRVREAEYVRSAAEAVPCK